jgi:peroxiredoxin
MKEEDGSRSAPAASVGRPAPLFRLPSADGTMVGLRDYHGRKTVMLWFTKGFGCPFCRQQMSHLRRALPALEPLDAAVLLIARTPPARARLYAKHFSLPFPYLCDSDGSVRSVYGLGERATSTGDYVKKVVGRLRNGRPPPSDFGRSGRLGGAPGILQSPGELARVLADEDAGLFIVDAVGTLRFSSVGAWRSEAGERWQLPSTDEIVGVLKEIKRSN